jgi:2-polyprenyl-3-methyl-5-hydroxy-6-metoxy-1,4-benzoquinol methylase
VIFEPLLENTFNDKFVRNLKYFPVRLIKKAKHHILNFFSCFSGNARLISAKYWQPKKLRDGKSSPSRKFLDQFLTAELLDIIPIKYVSLLDIGCGSGYVRKILADAGFAGEYTGVDLYKHKNFESFNSNSFKSILIESRIEDLNVSKRFDFIISITALEHIENDALTISKCSHLLKKDGIQMHIVPSSWSKILYIRHGYRQYDPKRIKMLFRDKIYKVYKLGGLFSFFLHLIFITIPVFILKTDKMRDLCFYPNLIEICNKLDGYFPICPALYVIITH